MDEYLTMLAHVWKNGRPHNDRTGTGTMRVFGYQMRHDLAEGFPLLTTKKVSFRNIVHELLWFIAGDTNEKTLSDKNVNIWADWVKEDGELGPIYGFQWRHFGAFYLTHRENYALGVDQLQEAVDQIQNNPNSRRIIVSAWNPVDLPLMVLPPCHLMFQFMVDKGQLSCHVNLRSADIFLGVPYNIASYALLTHMIAHVCDLDVGDLVCTYGDLHLYNNHRDQAWEQLNRRPGALPKLGIDAHFRRSGFTGLLEMEKKHIHLKDYVHRSAISAPISK